MLTMIINTFKNIQYDCYNILYLRQFKDCLSFLNDS